MRNKSYGVGFLLLGIATLGWVILSWVKYHDEVKRRKGEVMTLCNRQSVDTWEKTLKLGVTTGVDKSEKLLQELYENCLALHGVKLPARSK